MKNRRYKIQFQSLLEKNLKSSIRQIRSIGAT